MTRNEAVKNLKLYKEVVGMPKEFEDALDMAIEALEREHGKWVEDKEQNHVELTFHCSKCGCKAWGIEETTNFCPNCGADMREVKE